MSTEKEKPYETNMHQQPHLALGICPQPLSVLWLSGNRIGGTMNPKLFPTVLIALDVLAASVYASHGDIRKLIYWLSAAVLTAAVTY